MTFRVTTDRTLTGRTFPVRVNSKCRDGSRDQSAGEKGDLILALLGESVEGEKAAGEAGIRSRRSEFGGDWADRGCKNGDGGIALADGDLFVSHLPAPKLLEVEGAVVGVEMSDILSENIVGAALMGLEMMGVKALMKSV